ncbi:MAG: lysoplasmalogenase family protein [Bacillaceae bacterium]
MKSFLIWIACIQFIVVLIDCIWIIKKCKEKGERNGELHLIVRMGFSWSMVAVAFYAFLNVPSTISYYPLLIFMGMFCSAIGDVIMARLLPLKERLYGGMLFFAFAHVFYIAAYFRLLQHNNASYFVIFSSLAIGFILLSFIWRKIAYSPERPLSFNIATLSYALIIGTMGIVAGTVAYYSNGSFILPVIGAFIFVISDSLIAISEIQKKNFVHSALWVWITYVIAQLLIVYSTSFI